MMGRYFPIWHVGIVENDELLNFDRLQKLAARRIALVAELEILGRCIEIGLGFGCSPWRVRGWFRLNPGSPGVFLPKISH